MITTILVLLFFACKKSNENSQKEEKNQNQIYLDATLLDKVQKQTFRYFWEFSEPNSGMARERSQESAFENNSFDIITIGGSGFGLACFPVAVERGWIERAMAVRRLQKILRFLEGADTYYGAYSHWYFGSTGKTRPFSVHDDGGDIVETSFLIMGLLINRQYFSRDNIEEQEIRNRITAIWEAVQWDWYTQGNKAITWHWSRKNEFKMNIQVSGWNEALITYILAAASPTHSIDKATYDVGWARNGDMKNGKRFFKHKLFLGEDYGGPLFLSQYSFIGIDPRGLKDQYVHDYFEQNRNHSIINYNYCVTNPEGFEGYGESCWGITASDNYNGYSAHSPLNDLGVITPTAALSSFPYTPLESTKALKYFFKRKDELWGEYGFYDAFSDQFNWVSDGYLAIDQGPIVAMIENYRTQLLWSLFMQDKDVLRGLKKLGFSGPSI